MTSIPNKSCDLRVHTKFKDRDGKDWYAWKDSAVLPYVADMYVALKRLKDAELAAEHYRACFLHENSLIENDGYDGAPETQAHRRQARILYRFATFPHYDEASL